jgi:hypothetical protein
MDMQLLRQKSILARLARKESNKSRSGVLGEGWSYFPDSPPGVGIVLLSPHGNKSYHATQEQLLAYYLKICDK